MILLLNAGAHFAVDGLCAAVLFGQITGDKMALILLYNTLAFSTQCLVGLAADRIGHVRLAEAFSLIVLALAFFVPVPMTVKICMIGLGNSLFHVTGGIETLQNCRRKARDLGTFVAPGAVGLVLGTVFPLLGVRFAMLLLACAALLLSGSSILDRIQDRTPDRIPETGMTDPAQENGTEAAPAAKAGRREAFDLTIPLLLTCAVAVRAIGGSAVHFPWKTTASAALIMAIFVCLGKMAGGFLSDRIGCRKTALISLLPSALLIAFCSSFMVPSLAGQFLLNLSMPVTLWLLYRSMPGHPGFAFGLAASALWPGTIIGQLMTLTGPALWACVIISSLLGAGAILYALQKEERR